jgi:hypothetical protein
LFFIATLLLPKQFIVLRRPVESATNTCYSFINENEVIRSASVLTYSVAKKAPEVVPGSEGMSATPSQQQGIYAHDWASNIWSDMLS